MENRETEKAAEEKAVSAFGELTERRRIKKEKSRRSKKHASYSAIADVVGFTGIYMWAHFEYTGDVPWGSMLSAWFLVSVVVGAIGTGLVYAGRWGFWTSVALSGVAGALGTVAGMWLAQ